MIHNSGLGAYPGTSYYDPGRPAWLPYWIDTPTESAMKYGAYPGADTKTVYEPPKAPVPVAPPDARGTTWTPAQSANTGGQWSIPDLPQAVQDAISGKTSIGATWIYAAAAIAAALLIRGISK